MKRFLSVILSLAMCTTLIVPAFASSLDEAVAPFPDETVAPSPDETVAPSPDETVAPFPDETVAPSPDETISQDSVISSEMSPDFSNMSIQELNSFIHDIALQYDENDAQTARIIDLDDIRLAWMAAAEIATRAGYPCAGAVVKSSVVGRDYIESNGLIAETIKTTSAFASWKNTMGNYITFEKSDSSDLFYAIHKANIRISGNSSGARATVTDIFDFEFETNMEDLFSTIVNDWAWLCMYVNVLNEISVQVEITL